MSEEQHLDLDALADVLAGDPEPKHLADCAGCRSRLDELATDLPLVSQALADMPLPEMPADLPGRLLDALAAEREAEALVPPPVDVLPLRPQRTRWMPALGAAAAAAVIVASGVLLLQRSGGGSDADTAASTAGYALNDSHTNYTRSGVELQAALPSLLTGSARTATLAAPVPSAAQELSPQAGGSQDSAQKSSGFSRTGADPLAALRATTGLAACLNSLTSPGDTGLPLALDYATFEGRPALVVVLPTKLADKVDVFVVGPGCAKADGTVLYFRRLPKP